MIRALILALVLPVAAAAQTYPAYTSLAVNDFAGVLDDAAEARIAALVDDARRDPGVEITVVTIPRVATYAPGQTLEAFATGLFNAWGIGSRATNDGILILLSVEDRAVRIELGGAYPPVYDGRALRVIDVVMLPPFRQGDWAGGIETGVTAAVEDIARPFRAGASVTETSGIGDGGGFPGFLIFVIEAAVVAAAALAWFVFRRPHPRCPSCGKRGIVRHEEVMDAPTETVPGNGRETRRCPACGWSEVRAYSIPSLADAARAAAAGAADRHRHGGGGSGGGSFGGGSSSGGGASGRF
jgi:uncharacterized protein